MTGYLDDMEPFVSDLRKQFLDQMEQKITPIDDAPWSSLSEQIVARDMQLQSDNKQRAQDPPGAVYLKIACVLLATHQTLLPLYKDNDKILDFIREIITEIYIGKNLDAFYEDHFGISPEEPEKAWAHLLS